MEEYAIKRKSVDEPFKCPKCDRGFLEFIGNDLFRFKCLDCDEMFM